MRPDPREVRKRPIVRAAEPVDALIVVAHHTHIRAVARWADRPDHLDLSQIHILKLVHNQVLEIVMHDRRDHRVLADQFGGEHDQIVDHDPSMLAGPLLEVPVHPDRVREAVELGGACVAIALLVLADVVPCVVQP